MRHFLVGITLLLLALLVICGVASVLEMRATETEREAPAQVGDDPPKGRGGNKGTI